MPGCAALNASATWGSTLTWSGASPVPRQQYQRTATSPGFAAEPLTGSGVGAGGDSEPLGSPLAASDEDADGSTDTATEGALLLVGDEHAAKSNARIDTRTASRPTSRCMTLLLRFGWRVGVAVIATDVLLLRRPPPRAGRTRPADPRSARRSTATDRRGRTSGRTRPGRLPRRTQRLR